ncbi:MAG: radical SAM family heme chaperone HemW [Candidatus Eisenbacteria bacterium]|nr:radical SAM family heme chaperone HemW [Candidatus Eisenbacteria bacterium]
MVREGPCDAAREGPCDAAQEGPCDAARDQARAGLYVHVPFCAARCSYCDFSTGTLSVAKLGRYLDALEREIARRAPPAAGLRFTSVFFGGGTPSAIGAAAFERIARVLAAAFDIAPGAEFTLEANPESVRPALLEAWSAAGVNRLSLGAQSFVPEELATLARIHAAGRPAAALALARAHGFRRLSLDLMFGFPGQTAASWDRTLEAALALAPEHFSAYCLIPEAGTPLGDAVLAGATALPAPEAQAEAYEVLTARLEAAGYGCYETSNFCRPGAEARHNLVYWLRRPYLGLGPSAHGFDGATRYGNHRALQRWAAALEAGAPPEAEVERASEESAAAEAMMLGLRLATGLRPADHPPALRAALERRYGAALAAAVAGGRLVTDGASFRIPRPLRFVADDVIAWIAAAAARARVDSRRACSVPSMPCPSPPSPAA